jgi:sulfoxide reductase heme-binding subunit YedZ
MTFRWPWRERNGRFSALKAIAFGALLVPGLVTAVGLATGTLGARPIMEAIHEIGLWAIRLLMLSLAVTPLRQAWKWPRLLVLRRMIGVAAFAYALIHLGLYAVDQGLDLGKVVTEIALRIYLTIGFVTLLTLATLSVTSTDGMIRRLGARRWQRLHRIVYGAGILASIHYFLQSKLEVSEAVVVGGLFLWMMGYRIVLWTTSPARAASLPVLLGLSVAAAAIPALFEAFYFHFMSHVDVVMVLQADLSLETGWRPGQVVLLITLGVAAVAAFRAALDRYRKGSHSAPSGRPAQRTLPQRPVSG